jgi:hypothetical protein
MLTGGHDLTPGIMVTVSGIGTPSGFDGTFAVNAVSGTSCATQPCAFQAANTTKASQTAVNGVASSTIDNLFPQVTVVTTKSNAIETTVGLPGFPDATVVGSPYYVPVCATTRFRMTMAAAGDSTRAYLASCDGGNVNFIDTSTDTYLLNAPAPPSVRPPIPPSRRGRRRTRPRPRSRNKRKVCYVVSLVCLNSSKGATWFTDLWPWRLSSA